jgi:glucose-1-phosphate thymidylyltransferase
MEIAKALILAEDGCYARGWPATCANPGPLFPIANRPILFHNLEALRATGVLEAVILANAETAAAVRLAVEEGRDWGLNVAYSEWDSAEGLHGALSAGRGFVGDEPVLVRQADALLREPLYAHIAAFARDKLDALALRLPRPTGDVTCGYLLSSRAVSRLLEAREAADDPVGSVRALGGRGRVQSVDGCLPCRGDLDALLESNRCVLQDLVAAVDITALDDCDVQGAVSVHPTAQIRRTLLRGPAILGPGVRVTDAYIGPYTSIGARAVIEGSEIEHSIVLPEAELRFIGTRIESSVIGRGARIAREFRVPGAIRLSVGDGAEVVLT